MKNWYNVIETYNLGKMHAPQRAQFEAAMADDPALAQAVQQHRIEWEAGELLAEKALRAQIRQLMREQADKPGSWFSINWKWALLVTTIMAAGAAVIFKNKQPVAPAVQYPSNSPLGKDSIPPTPPSFATQEHRDTPIGKPVNPPVAGRKIAGGVKAMALAAYQSSESFSQVRSLAGENDSLSLAQEAFAKKDYRLALRYLSSLPLDSRQEGLSLRGHSHFLAGDYAAASNDFSELRAGGVYIRDAQWFGLLATIATPGADKNNWMKRLDAICLDKKHPFQKDAAALLEKLEKR